MLTALLNLPASCLHPSCCSVTHNFMLVPTAMLSKFPFHLHSSNQQTLEQLSFACFFSYPTTLTFKRSFKTTQNRPLFWLLPLFTFIGILVGRPFLHFICFAFELFPLLGKRKKKGESIKAKIYFSSVRCKSVMMRY